MISEGSGKKIKGRKIFELIYSKGKTVYSKDKLLKAGYSVAEVKSTTGFLIAVAVSSKAGGAVWRNKLKRLIYELVRAEKEQITRLTKGKNICLLIIFSSNKLNQKHYEKINTNFIRPAVTDIFNKLRQRVDKLSYENNSKR